MILPRLASAKGAIHDSGFQGLRRPGACLPVKGTKKHPLGTGQRDRDRLPKTDDRFNLPSAGLRDYFIG
ncbi:MAG: hypothetical protein LBM92_00105 [Opitutaceae bacterium]|nr:hypothetical protein [Opitutaceae bacterium]